MKSKEKDTKEKYNRRERTWWKRSTHPYVLNGMV